MGPVLLGTAMLAFELALTAWLAARLKAHGRPPREAWRRLPLSVMTCVAVIALVSGVSATAAAALLLIAGLVAAVCLSVLLARVRVSLAAGESRTGTFETPVGQLGFYGRDLAYVVEPGRLDVLVGTSNATSSTGCATTMPTFSPCACHSTNRTWSSGRSSPFGRDLAGLDDGLSP